MEYEIPEFAGEKIRAAEESRINERQRSIAHAAIGQPKTKPDSAEFLNSDAMRYP